MDKKLTQNEAARVRTELEDKYHISIKYRYLVGYTPAEIAKRIGDRTITAKVIYGMAGRQAEMAGVQ